MEQTLNAEERPALLALLRSMLLIRTFEERVRALPRPGFQLFSSGEEAAAVGVCAALQAGDPLLSSGRSIGPALARGVEPGRLLAELLGKTAGPCQGKAGRGHVADLAAGFFGAHAVVGGNLTIAAGVALALHMQRRPHVAVCIFGDGASASGALHETLNLAALWRLPLLLVCNNNQYSVSTPVRQGLAVQPLAELARPFGVRGRTIDGMDVLAVRAAAVELAALARAGSGPSFLECVTYRFLPHSTATREDRAAAEIAAWTQRCPLRLLTQRLQAAGLLDDAGRDQLQREVSRTIDAAESFADAASFPDPAEGLRDVD